VLSALSPYRGTGRVLETLFPVTISSSGHLLPYTVSFYPRDSTLLAIALCLFATSTCRCFVETSGRIELAFGTEVAFDLSHTCIEIQVGLSTKKSTSLWIILPEL